MSDAIMTLQFEGDAVDAGAMNVRQLSPVLIAAADVIRDAHFLLGAPGRPPQVELQATAPGSVIFDLLVTDPHALQHATNLLTSPSVTATANLSALVGAVVDSIGAVKKLGGRAIAKIRQVTSGQARVDLNDGSSIEMPQESARLVSNSGYRRLMRGMVEPLASNRGIRSLTVSTDGQSQTVMTNDYPSFVAVPAVKDDAEGALDRLDRAPAVEDGAVRVSQSQLAVGRVEDPREMIDYFYQRQLELLQEVHRDVADVATARKQVELQMNQLQQSPDRLDRQARDSLTAGREDLARVALARKADVQGQLGDLEALYDSLQSAEERLTIVSQRLQAKVDAFRIKKEAIKAILTAAQAEARVNEVLAGISEEVAEVGRANQQAEDKTEQTQARAGALDELMASGALDDVVSGSRDDIQAELDQMSASPDLDAELSRLKAEIAGHHPDAASHTPTTGQADQGGETAPAQNDSRPGGAGQTPTTGQADQSG